jgi:tetratricopeptide (TPR) repeat protein/TolB-like protein
MTALALMMALAVAAQAPAPNRILVMPFENAQRDGRIFWLGEGAAVLLTDDLSGLAANAISREERQQAFERLQVPPAAVLTDATIIRIGQIVGAANVILGTLQMDHDTLVVRARSVALESGRVTADVTVRGSLDALFPTFERVARQISPSARPGAAIGGRHPTLAVFENFIKGLLAETPATAVNYLTTALKLQPTFDRARVALWDVYAEQSEHEKALAAVKPVPADSPWARRARFLAGLSEITLKKYDDAFATFKALADSQPTPTVLNNVGVTQLRRGVTSAQSQNTSATQFFTRAVEADPDHPDYLFNLGYAYWQSHDMQAAIYWLRETVRRNPADGDAHFVLGAALAATGKAAEAGREKELARRLSSMYAEWEKRTGAEPVPKGLERIKNEVELPHARPIEAKLRQTGQRDQEELAHFYLDRARRLYQQEHDRDATNELNHALYLSPYLADAHLLLGRIHLRNGRVRDASDAFKIALWSAETAETHAALGEAYRQANDLAAAREEAERALALDPFSNEARQLLARLDAR